MREKRRKQMVLIFIRWTFSPKLPDFLKSCNTHPSITDPVESISSLGSRRKRHRIAWFIFHQVFLLSCVLPIKVEKGDRPYIFTATLNTFYIKLLLYREELIKRFTLFYASLITCALRILFLSMVIMFYICASINKYEQ